MFVEDSTTDSTAVIETRLTHNVHRLASSLLAEAALRETVPLPALEQLRDFLVANLHHHHESEDDDLWPQITAVAPEAAQALDELSGEHQQLDQALDLLASVPTTAGDLDVEAVRRLLYDAAVAVRDVVHAHLSHEEPVLFPALRAHVTAAAWADFAQRVIATTPPVAGHLMVGFLDEAGTPEEVALVLSGLPEALHPLLPAMRAQASEDLRVLRNGA
ncbi:hemerythrin domain-containing protein [Streptomyces griseoluteus]